MLPQSERQPEVSSMNLLRVNCPSLSDWTGVGMCGLEFCPCEVLYMII